MITRSKSGEMVTFETSTSGLDVSSAATAPSGLGEDPSSGAPLSYRVQSLRLDVIEDPEGSR